MTPELQPYQRELLDRLFDRDGRLVPRRVVLVTPRQRVDARLVELLEILEIIESRRRPR